VTHILSNPEIIKRSYDGIIIIYGTARYRPIKVVIIKKENYIRILTAI